MSKVFVLDTNVLVSASLIGASINAEVLDRVFRTGILAFSEATFSELLNVLYRPKFDKYLSDERRSQIIARIERNSKRFFPKEVIKACRDPKDNMLLELAVSAEASCIVTGDKDLQILDPFGNIRILSPADFIPLF